jgi:replicative DNA helicase
MENITTAKNVNEAAPEKPRLYGLASLLGDLKDDADRRKEAKDTGKRMGAVTGLPKLDEGLGGYLTVGTHALHGDPGVGKTAFALQIAASCGCPSIFVTCEMPPLELVRRHTSRVTQTYLGRLKSGELSGDVVHQKALQAAKSAPFLFLLDATRAPAPPASIVESIETVRASDPENPHLLIVVDSLHSWADALGDGDIEYERLSLGCQSLRTLALSHDCAVLFTSERNRASKGKNGQSSGAGSRKIEYGAETVIGLNATNTDDDDNVIYDEATGETDVSAMLGKNRNGAPGKSFSLKFHGATQTYREV